MQTKLLILPAVVFALASAACAPPKVMVGHVYASDDKSINTYIQKSGAAVGDGKNKTELFNVHMRVCNQDANNGTSVCKDSLILANVDPKSL